MSSSKPPLVLIAGPTGSGKSALALVLAQQINGVIVNADSAQMYRDLRILSARPDDAQLNIVEHRLYGVVDGVHSCSAIEWADMARREIAAIHASEKTPILVGGTGLYIRTLLDGIAPVTTIDPDVRAQIRATALHVNRAELARLDPLAYARLGSNDTSRINRALEVIVSTGRPLSEWQEERTGGIATAVELQALIVQPDRDWLYQRCNDRFVEMTSSGAIAEVEVLLKRGLDPTLPVMRAIGVGELASYLNGRSTLAAAIALGQQATRRYAKRQYTWFAHQAPAMWPRFHDALEPPNLSRALALLETSA